jgi:predicted SnoaL-like aldol condensation-catalyzing enzyme
MGEKLDNVVHFFVDGVTEGRLRTALDQYVAFSMIEHGPAADTGRRGLADAYAPIVARYDRRFVQPIRGFEDGPSVLLHTFQSYGYGDIERVCFDIADTDEDHRIIEHWSVSAPLARIPRSGYSQIDGPTFVEDVGITVPNKRLVAAYTAEVVIGRDADRGPRYVAIDCVDHDPNAGPCEPGLALTGPHTAADGLVRYLRVVRLLGCGNFVATLSDITIDGKPGLVCDLYRLHDACIVEHWNTMQAVPVRPRTPADAVPVRSTVGRRPVRRYTVGARRLDPA